MSDVTIPPEELSDFITKWAKIELDENKDKIIKGVKKIARESKNEIEVSSPVSQTKYDGNTDNYKGSKRFAQDNSKHYKESWTTTTVQENGNITIIVHNKKWQLVHLLENGHLTRKGTGRTVGKGKERTEAYEHVKPVSDTAEKEVDALLEGL